MIRVLLFFLLLTFAGSAARADEHTLGDTKLRFGITGGYYYQSADLKKLPGKATVNVGAATSPVKNLKGEVTEHGIYIAPKAGYYFDRTSNLELGIEIEPGLMVSLSSDVKVKGNPKTQLENDIEAQVLAASLNYTQVSSQDEDTSLNLFTDAKLAANPAENTEEKRIRDAVIAAYDIAREGQTGAVAIDQATAPDAIRTALDDLENDARKATFAQQFLVAYLSQLRSAEAGGLTVNEQLTFAALVDTAAKETVIAAEQEAIRTNTSAQNAVGIAVQLVGAVNTAQVLLERPSGGVIGANAAFETLVTGSDQQSVVGSVKVQTVSATGNASAAEDFAQSLNSLLAGTSIESIGINAAAATNNAHIRAVMANTATQSIENTPQQNQLDTAGPALVSFVEATRVSATAADHVNAAAPVFASNAAAAVTSANAANRDLPARQIVTNLFPGSTATPTGAVQVSNLDKSPTLFHVTVPVYAVANFKSETVTGNLGVGTGIMFYDLGDKVNGGTSWPILVKAGLHYPFRDNMNIGGDVRFHYAIAKPSDVDSIWGIRAGVAFTYFFQ